MVRILYFSLIAVFLFKFSGIFASNSDKGYPLLVNYPASVYKADPQNWDIVQDDRGVMYFANGNGVLTYDGHFWNLIPLPHEISARALGKDMFGTIYAGGTNEFGYLNIDANGRMYFISLADSLGIEKIGIIRQIICNENEIFFRSSDYLIRYTSKGFKSWKAKSSYSLAFVLNRDLFIIDESRGLFKVANDTIVEAPASQDFANKKFWYAHPYQNGVILANRIKGLYRYVPVSISDMKLESVQGTINPRLIRDFVVCGKVLSDQKIVMGTNNGGCIIMDQAGNIVEEINKKTGLQHNNVHALYTDNSNNLWIALDNGISRCDISGPVSYWNELNGLEGYIISMIKYKDVTYIASLQGLYYLKNSKIFKIEGELSQAWAFLVFKIPGTNRELLLVGGQEGIFEISGFSLTKICDASVTYCMFQSKKNSEIVYVGKTNNIGILQFKNDRFQYQGEIQGTGISIRSVAEGENNELWVTTYHEGIYCIYNSTDILQPVKIEHFDITAGLPSLKNNMIAFLHDKMVFSTRKGIYFFDNKTMKFTCDTSFSGFFTGESKDVYALAEDASGNVFLAQLAVKEGSIGLATRKGDGTYIWDPSPYNCFPPMTLNLMYLDDHRNLWIGGSDGLYKYDHSVKKKYQFSYHTLIRKVCIGRDSCIFYGNFFVETSTRKIFSFNQNSEAEFEIPFRCNTLKFEFAAPDFSNEFATKYRYKLLGYDDEWSEWTNSSQKEYTNLHEGDYKFIVVSKNVYNISGSEASFAFTVLPPWYRTGLAYLCYAALVLLIVFAIVRISMWRLRRININLEKQVKQRTLEINQQKEEITAQADELARQNKELEKLSIVASETDNAIAIAGADGNLQWVNDGFTRLYGFTFDDLIKRNWTTIIDFSLTPNIREKIEHCIINKETITYESLNRTKSGQNIWSHTTITPIVNTEGLVTMLVAIDSDISKLKMAEMEILQHEQEIEAQRDFAEQQKILIEQQNIELEKHHHHLEQLVRERTAELEIAKEKAEESDRLKSAFLANMSHEIRTPMNAIIGFSSLLVDEEVTDEEKKEYTRRIIQNSSSLMHLIDDIVNVSIIEAGQLKIFKKNTDINMIFRELLQVYTSKLQNYKDSQIEIRHNIADINKVFILSTDASRLQQILANLLDNAIKFTERGSITMGYEVVKHDSDPVVRFFVRDTGIGMNEKQKNSLFERFSKADDSKEKLYRGAGLGLNLCKNLVMLLGGRIWVDSELNAGSTFYFTLPYETVADGSPDRDLTHEDLPKNLLDGKTILVAEDEESNYKLLEAILLKANVRILHATNGVEAIEMVKNNHVDLILMDVKMPVMNGLEATKIIKGMGLNIPIIAQTAFAFESDEITTYHSGCDAYIAKPIHRPKLIDLINQLLK